MDEQIDDLIEDEQDERDDDECCDDCGCYHGHYTWCDQSDNVDDF